MNRISFWFVVAVISVALCSCVTTRQYEGGTVKSSRVSFKYTSPAILSDPAGKTYSLLATPPLHNIVSVPELDAMGLRRVAGPADLNIAVTSSPVQQEAVGTGVKTFQPGLQVSMPVKIDVFDRQQNSLFSTSFSNENVLTLPGSKTFPTRQEAVAAMKSASSFFKNGVEEKVHRRAADETMRSLTSMAQELSKPREMKVDVPAIQFAGSVDMKAQYEMLSGARSPEQAQNAVAAYVKLGTDHKRPDGSADAVANYGVLCGSAAARIVAGDLRAAWDDIKAAHERFPSGDEHRELALVVKNYQESTGTVVIPKTELNAIGDAATERLIQQFKALNRQP